MNAMLVERILEKGSLYRVWVKKKKKKKKKKKEIS